MDERDTERGVQAGRHNERQRGRNVVLGKRQVLSESEAEMCSERHNETDMGESRERDGKEK